MTAFARSESRAPCSRCGPFSEIASNNDPAEICGQCLERYFEHEHVHQADGSPGLRVARRAPRERPGFALFLALATGIAMLAIGLGTVAYHSFVGWSGEGTSSATEARS